MQRTQLVEGAAVLSTLCCPRFGVHFESMVPPSAFSRYKRIVCYCVHAARSPVRMLRAVQAKLTLCIAAQIATFEMLEMQLADLLSDGGDGGDELGYPTTARP